MPEPAMPWNQQAEDHFKDVTDVAVLKQELCKNIFKINDLEEKVQSQATKISEMNLEMGLKVEFKSLYPYSPNY